MGPPPILPAISNNTKKLKPGLHMRLQKLLTSNNTKKLKHVEGQVTKISTVQVTTQRN